MKTNRAFLFYAFVLLSLVTTSCVTPKQVQYLRDMPLEGVPLTESLEAVICPYDELRIYVLSNSGEEELVKPFNVLGAAGQNVGYSMGYLVDVNGNIQFPVLGNLHVAGLTRLQLQDSICAHLERNGHLSNPSVMVRFLNFKVFFLSSHGGKVITVNNERCTFLEALAMSGGLDYYTRRDRIGVMREVDGKRVIHYLDPRSISVFEDEFFLLQQNDIIFTEETGFRLFRETYSNWTVLLSAVTSIASLITLYKTFEALKK